MITLDVNGTSSSMLLAYQLGMNYNSNNLEYLGASSGNLPEFSQDNFAAKTGEIRTIWMKTNGQPENMLTPKTLFKLHFKVLNDFCNIQNELGLSNLILENIAYDQSGTSVPTALSFSTYVVPPKGKLLSVSPNPAINNVSFNFLVNTSSTVEIRISDFNSNILQFNQQYSPGSFTHTFSNLSSLNNGTLNYTIKIGDVTYSGLIIKSLP